MNRVFYTGKKGFDDISNYHLWLEHKVCLFFSKRTIGPSSLCVFNADLTFSTALAYTLRMELYNYG